MKRDVRYLALDTETTGIEPSEGHRIVEIGLVEFMNGIVTGSTYQAYLNPQRDMPQEAFDVHGLSEEFLADKPLFAEKYREMLEFCAGAEIVIHHAAFDLKHLDAELERVGEPSFGSRFVIKDSLQDARRKYPGKSAKLDDLCSRLGVNNSGRKLHGALLDADLLAEVYMKMAGADGLAYAFETRPSERKAEVTVAAATVGTQLREALGGGDPLPEELERHAYLIGKIKNPLWDALPAA
jgi:DNA polymerase-3 subunit epsilon